MEFETILTAHRERYPEMEHQDYGKLAFQNTFGPEHLVADAAQVLDRLREEWNCSDLVEREPEDIGNGLVRFHLNPGRKEEAPLLAHLFCRTAKEHSGDMAGLEETLTRLEKLDVPGMGEWLAEYRNSGCPAVRHSERYRNIYRPHYRLLTREYACWFPVLKKIYDLRNRNAVVAIDGRCGSGKTTLASLIARVFDCNVFHMDDFYRHPSQRAVNWMELPGGNMDLVRFREEVLKPAFAGETVTYRPYDCQRQVVGEGVPFVHKGLTIVEGSYSHHPELEANYDLKIFLTCDKQEQQRRLMEREGAYYPTFARVWAPLEEQYIRLCHIGVKDTLVVDTGRLEKTKETNDHDPYSRTGPGTAGAVQ